MIYYVTLSPRGHELSLDILARSGPLDVAHRRANLRHEPLTFDMNR